MRNSEDVFIKHSRSLLMKYSPSPIACLLPAVVSLHQAISAGNKNITNDYIEFRIKIPRILFSLGITLQKMPRIAPCDLIITQSIFI